MLNIVVTVGNSYINMRCQASREMDAVGFPRFYCPGGLQQAHVMPLPEQAAHHAARVLRLQAGDKVTLFDGQGGEYDATIERISKTEVTVLVESWLDRECESPLRVTLVQALSSGEKMDFTVQKAVELGVAAIQPVISNRSVVKLAGERADKRVQHWQSVVISACEQCGRNRVAPVNPILPLTTWLAEADHSALRIVFAPDAALTLHELPLPEAGVTVLAGPEGGFTEAEIAAASTCGFTPVRLGPRVLRTETSALAAIAAMQVLWGDF